MEEQSTDPKQHNSSSKSGQNLTSRQILRADIIHDKNRESQPSTAGPASNVRTKSPSRNAPARYHVTPTKESPGFITRITGMLYSSPVPDSTKHSTGQQSSKMEAEIEHLQKLLHEKDNVIRQESKSHKRDIDSMQTKLQSVLDAKDQEWDTREIEFQRYIKKINDDRDERERKLQADVNEVASDRRKIQQQYNEFIRQKQEESFKQMESARWLPSEGRKVVSDLDRIKRDIRGWAKGTAIKDISFLQTLDVGELSDLMKELSCVVLLEDNKLPNGLSTPKSPSLLLNALLAHDVYTNLFQNPFFFLKDDFGHDLPRLGLDAMLDKIYHLAEGSNQQDAHMWRSQTLRLLLPPLRTSSSEGEVQIHSWTEGLIAQAAERQASHFIAGPARHLISKPAAPDAAALKKIKDIYQGAATVSYQLWTRRTHTKCTTLREMGHPTFDPDSTSLVPHTLVRYDDHEDMLRGRPITVVVHPLLQVFGTDEGQDYDQGTVWAPAEVWLDSKVSSPEAAAVAA